MVANFIFTGFNYKKGVFMNISKINSNQSFQALNFQNVAEADRKFIKNNFKQLKELGEKYDIGFVSTYADVPGHSAIDVSVKPLKENLNFWQRLFPPRGMSTFQTNKNSIFDAIDNAIADLLSKTSKRN